MGTVEEEAIQGKSVRCTVGTCLMEHVNFMARVLLRFFCTPTLVESPPLIPFVIFVRTALLAWSLTSSGLSSRVGNF